MTNYEKIKAMDIDELVKFLIVVVVVVFVYTGKTKNAMFSHAKTA